MTSTATTVRERVELPAPPSAGAAGAVVGGITAQDVLGILKRRIVLVILLSLLLGSMTVGAWLVAYRYFPLYPAEAFVECISDKPKPIYTAAEHALTQKDFERFVLTQARFVKSPNVRMEVLRTAEVKGTQWFREHQDRLLLDFEELVRAAPDRGTNLLRISVATRNRDDPHVIVNQVVKHYLARAKEYNVGPYRRERTSYQNDLETVMEHISDRRKQLSELQKRLPPGYAGFASDAAARDYGEAKTAVAQLELTSQELESLYAIYTQPGGTALSPEDAQWVESDPTVSAMANYVFTVRQQLEIERTRLGANHRTVRRMEREREVAEQELDKLRERRLTEVLAFREEQVRTAWLTSQNSLLLAREKLGDVEAYMADMDSVVTQYRTLEEEIGLLKEKRDQINNYIGEVERIIRERAAIRVELRQEAIPPEERSFPRFIMVPVGLVLSLAIAMGIPLLLEFADTSLRTPRDMVRHLRIPLLGVIPDADDEEVDISSLETAVRDAPQSMFAEVFRTIRTNLHFTTTADRRRSIVITSPRPEDGKTTVACNLAMMVATGGQRVLLVDANFRKPMVHRLFPGETAGGLSNILVGSGKFAELVGRTDLPGMDVLRSGPLPPNPAELVGSKQMDDFIAEVTQLYDQVILDAPPVLLASDACVLATKTDGAILVCRAKANSRGIGARACELLGRVEAHVFGGILNAAQVSRGGYFREQLRTFYDYHVDDEDAYARLAALPKGAGSESGGAQLGVPTKGDSEADRGGSGDRG